MHGVSNFFRAIVRNTWGWMRGGNLIAPKELWQARIAKCDRCAFLDKSSRQCQACECFVDVKATLVSEDCEMGLWK